MEDDIRELSINPEVSGEAPDESTVRKGPKQWSVVVLSAVGSAAAVAAVGCFCALVYPILKGKRARELSIYEAKLMVLFRLRLSASQT